jgi:ATP-binding cassette, subfamily B, multidrug efflux pump
MIFLKNNSKTETRTLNTKLPKAQGLKKLLLLALPHSKKIILAGIFVILINMSLILKPYILKLVIDDFLVKHVTHYGVYSITSMGVLYFLVVVLGGILSIAQVNLINKAGQEIMRSLRSRVYKTIQLLPLSYLDKMSPGKLITRATNDIEALSEMYTDVIISLFQDVFLLIGIIYTMLAMNVKLAIISFLVVPIMFFVVFLLKKKIKQNFSKVKNLIGKINGFMAENISGMRIIQVFRAEKEKKKEFSELNDAYFKTTSFQVWLNSFLKPAADFLQSIAVAIILWYGIGRISNHSLELGVLYAFTSYIKQFFNPISDLADNYTTIQSALVSADRIFELLDEEDNSENLESGMHMEHAHGNIEFKHVWFSYNNNDWVLKDVSFKIKKGEIIAFVGETGAGKTTIISLINRFYSVQRGEILIDGININDINLRDLRKNIAVVLQDVFLFSGNIKKNISLNDDIEDDEIIEALKISHSYDFVNNMTNGIEEPVMERGNTFSAGQRQLLSFARAIAHDPAIFVLDEATANIDTHTEKLIQKAIENVAKDRTTLIIAHRLSTIRNADSIIVLNHGKILEIGSHEELVKNGGYYSNMLNKDEKAFDQLEPEIA